MDGVAGVQCQIGVVLNKVKKKKLEDKYAESIKSKLTR